MQSASIECMLKMYCRGLYVKAVWAEFALRLAVFGAACEIAMPQENNSTLSDKLSSADARLVSKARPTRRVVPRTICNP